jgi:hypothetical protein
MVEDLTRFWEVEQGDEGRVECVHKLLAQPEALGFIPFKRGGDIVLRRIK